MLLRQATVYLIIIIGNIVAAFTPECGPRDVVAAGRTCNRACLHDGTCRRRNRECVCDGLCGLSCLRKRCPILTSPLNGNMVVNPIDRTIGAEVSYSCNDGYVISGQTNRICQANKTWTGTAPMCTDSTTEGPRQECPERDEVAAGRNCEKACQPDGTCKKENRECVCDGLCGLTCMKKRCPPLPTPRNGSLVINPYDRTIGAEVTYSCYNGYVISGSRNRICQANKTWSGTQPTCTQSTIEAISCPDPGVPDDGIKIGSDYSYNEVVSYECNTRYILEGQNSIRCQANGTWNAPRPTCRLIQCRSPDEPRNGHSDADLEYYGQQGTIMFDCVNGYTLRGSRVITCNEHEQWSPPPPVCLAISCPDPGVPDDGIKIGSNYSYNEVVSYECNTRYILEGQSSIRCQANGTWNAPRPTCRLIQCRRPDEPRNGRSDANLEYYEQQGIIRFDCDRGYTLRGSSVITCNEHEQWSPPSPVCLGQCRIPSCPSNGRWTINNGGWYSNCRSNRMVDPGFRLTYRCDNGYFKCQQIEPVCNDRVWEPDTQNLCVPLGCSFVTLRDPRLTASYTYSGTHECFHSTYHQQETVIEYSCHRGYKIRDGDPNQATCQRRYWMPQQQPICVEVTCPHIQFPYGSVRYQQNGPFTSNRGHTATAHFSCIEGYTLEGYTISCDNGIWNDTIPTCVEEPCSVASLEWYNMDVQYEVPPGSNEITAGLKPAGTTANFICRQNGFEASQTKRCERGRWRGMDPVCLRTISCPDPGVPDDGIKIGSDYSYNETVSYECNNRYILEGQSSIKCQANGTWNAPRPTCRLIQCRRPDEPRNGRSDADLEYYGQQGTIRFDCDRGYTLRGSRVITCNEHEQWSPPPPVCLGQCRIPSCPSNGRWTINNGGWYSNCRSNRMVDPGFRLTYRCDNGYFKCQQIEPVCNDRVWEPDTQNLCVPLGCSFVTLRDPRLTASYTYSGTHECFHSTYHQQETVIEYSCHRGYKIRDGDPNQATCQRRYWMPQQQPVCVEVTCPHIQFPYGSVRYQQNGPFTSNRGHTATAHFSCIEGYTLEGYTISCDNGIWNDTIPTCVEEPCSVASLERYNMDVQYEVPPGSNEITAGLKPAGTTANFICRQNGFEASQTKRCERGRWRGMDPVCLRTISCPDPGVPDDGIKIGSDYSYNETVSYECNNRYILEGQSSIRCQANGTWNAPRPTCRLIQCRRPDEPRNGRSDADLEYYGQQGTIRFDCDRGYTLRGSRVITCNEHEQWSPPPPVCLGQCRIPSCPFNGRWTINNDGWYSNCRSNRMVDPGFRLTYRCDNGYFKCQQIEPVCNDRVWEPDTQNLCVPLGCSFVTLRDPRLTASYTYSGTHECFHSTYHQQETVIEYSCHRGYKIRDGDPNQATCQRRYWMPQQQPVCVEVTCPYIQFPHGSVTYQQNGPFTSNRGHTATAHFRCIEGYRLERHTISCDNGIWNDTIPTCVEEPCSVASLERYNMDVQYEVLPGSNEITAGLKPAGTTANFICRQNGFEASQTKRCERGRWRGMDPVCLRTISCPDPGVPDDGIKIGSDYSYNEIVSYECNNRYILEGQGSIRCQANGTWNAPRPTCRLIQCRRPDEPRNGRSDADLEYYGQQGTIRFDCNRGYTRRGSNVITCNEHEQWSPPPPVCLGQCRIPSCPSNGRWTMFNGGWYINCRSNRMVDPGFRLTYRCDNGYFKCQQIEPVCNDRVWEPDTQNLCVPLGCSFVTLRDPRLTASYTYSGTHECFHSTYHQQETVIEYSCHRGYKIRDGDPSQATCQGRRWMPQQQPVCVEAISCPDPGVPDDGIKIGSDYSYNEIVSYECNNRYILEGQSSIRCQANGTWNAPLPTCRLIQCRRPDEPRNGRSDAELEYYGQQGTIRFDCDNGYTLRGSRVITCNEHEQWSPPRPRCLLTQS